MAYLEAGKTPPKNLKAHSTRAMAASWASKAAVAPDEICKAATWSSMNTFIRHYQLDVQASVDAKFGRTILQAATKTEVAYGKEVIVLLGGCSAGMWAVVGKTLNMIEVNRHRSTYIPGTTEAQECIAYQSPDGLKDRMEIQIPCQRKGNKQADSQQNKLNKIRQKGIVRWHGAVSTNLMNHNVLIPNDESTSGSDSESLITSDNKKKSFGQKMKFMFGKVVPTKQKESQPTKLQMTGTASTMKDNSGDFPVQNPLPKIIKHLPIPREKPKGTARRISQSATLQLDINVIEAERERVTSGNVVVRSRKMTRRVSVTSVPSGLKKSWRFSKKKNFAFVKKRKKPLEKIQYHPGYTVGNLQMEVDQLLETIAEKSTKLLEQRHEELRKCESLGDEILQSSKQFQRISKKSTRKYKFKNVCFPCICCCY
ncbi:uncharacterized protein C3orf49 homolog [Rhinophrynus dorsalis]